MPTLELTRPSIADLDLDETSLSIASPTLMCGTQACTRGTLCTCTEPCTSPDYCTSLGGPTPACP